MHTASPFFYDTKDPQNDLIKPAVEVNKKKNHFAFLKKKIKKQGTRNVLKSIEKFE